MTAADLRDLIRDRIAALGITRYRAAQIAGVPDDTLADYLGGKDTTTARALAVAAALGLDVTARPRKGYATPDAPRRGRKPQESQAGK